LIDPQGRATRLGASGPGASRVIDYPNGDRHEYVHDIDARLLRFDVNGETHAQYQRDEKSDSLEVKYRDGGYERFVFAQGRIVEAVNEHAHVKLQYDDAGRLLTEETDGRVVRYLRNEVGALVGLVTPQGETIVYSRDRDQRLSGIADWAQGHYEIVQAPSGPPLELRYPNGLTATTRQDAMGFPSAWVVKRATGGTPNLDGAVWEHDSGDRLVASIRDGKERDYRYDQCGRLVEVRSSHAALNERFQLDGSGNRRGAEGAPCQYDAMNRLLRQGNRSFQYDGSGNQTADNGGEQPCTSSYNGRGQLVGIKTGGRLIEYAYDALGRRIRKRVGEVTTDYQWAGTQLLSENTVHGVNAGRRDYLVCPEFLTPLAFRDGADIFYVHCGRLHEPLCVTDKHGQVVWKAEYLAFGRALVSVERVRQPWRLPGQYHDEETGLHYSVARYYNPDLGRFLSMDPSRIAGVGLNYYLYCDGDPLNRVDPTGEISLTLGTVLVAIAVGVAVGAAIGAGVELYKQRNQPETDWSQVGYAALIGGCLGGIGAAVFTVAAAAGVAGAAALGAGAVAASFIGGGVGGAAGAAAEYCVEAAGKGEWHWGDFATAVGIGAAVGSVTMGIGGVIAARNARRAAEAAKKLADAEAQALREAEELALKQAAEKAAAEKAASEAAKQASKNPDAIALGLSTVKEKIKLPNGQVVEGARDSVLADFAKNVDGTGKSAATWTKFEPVIDPESGLQDMGTTIKNAMKDAKEIHFNREGMTNFDEIVKNPDPSLYKPPSTNWELATLLSDPTLKPKVKIYNGPGNPD
jgi:RHS repeat-associated protein